MALSPHRGLVGRSRIYNNEQAGTAWMAGLQRRDCRSAHRNLPGWARRSRLWRSLHTRELADAEPRRESRDAARQHERRGRWADGRVLSEFRAGLWQAENSQQVLHGVRFVQALSRRYLQPVVQLGAPFFIVQ